MRFIFSTLAQQRWTRPLNAVLKQGYRSRTGAKSADLRAGTVLSVRDRCTRPVHSSARFLSSQFKPALNWTRVSNDEAREDEKSNVKNEGSTEEPSLVIFDKDGTIICFHTMWMPWVTDLAKRIEQGSGFQAADIAQDVFRLLGCCPKASQVRQGLLAESTMPEIRGKLVQLLVIYGYEIEDACQIITAAWSGWDAAEDTQKIKALVSDVTGLFDTLRRHNFKVALCTADNRQSTLRALQFLNLTHLVDGMICGDDMDSKPKPHPHNAQKLCRELGVHPKRAYVVGDTRADLLMGKSAELSASIAVLSGVGTRDDLQPHADFVIPHIGDLLPLLQDHRKNVSCMENERESTNEDETQKTRQSRNRKKKIPLGPLQEEMLDYAYVSRG